MRFRDILPEDYDKIKEINEQQIHRYDLDSPEFVLGGVAVDDFNQVVGFGAVKIVHECVIILDQRRHARTRIEAAKLLIKNGVEQSKAKGIKFWHAFCDFEFALILERWFNFEPIEGHALILPIEDKQDVEKRREEDARSVAVGQKRCSDSL